MFVLVSNRSSSRDQRLVQCTKALVRPATACNYIKAQLKKEKDTCRIQKPFILCKSEIAWQKNGDFEYSFDCSFMAEHCDNVFYGIMDPKLGRVEYHHFPEEEALEVQLETISKTHNFVFLKCTLKPNFLKKFKIGKYSFALDGSAVQLIWFLQKIAKNEKNDLEKAPRHSAKPNINVIYLDSVSRTVFYYALPRTVKIMKKLSESEGRKVFDYKLFQSVERGSYGNLRHLFNGDNMTIPTMSGGMSYQQMGVRFFNKFKERGYTISYMTDYSYTGDRDLDGAHYRSK